MKRTIKSHRPVSLLAILVAFGVGFGLGQPAWAERSDDSPNHPIAADTSTATAPSRIAGLDDTLMALAKDPMFDGLDIDWAGMLNFYDEHGGAALFTTPTGLTPLGEGVRTRVPQSAAVGLKVPAPVLAAIATLPTPNSPETQARAEALLAAAFIGTAVDATTVMGDSDTHGAQMLDKADRVLAKKPDGVKNLLDEELPTYYRFWALLNYLPQQIAYLEKGGWPRVPSVKKLEPGQSSEVVGALRARLSVTGELAAADMGSDNVYDPKLVAAVELFQRNHGLNDDGVIGARTIEEMNVTAENRVRQILLNLERMRDEGPKFEARHLIANIPSQEVKVIEDGKVTFYTKAIFGKLERKSPTLSSVIHTVKLNPDWTAPAKIAAIDEVKRERANPGFLEAKGFTIYDRNGNVVSPRAIDWHEVGPGNFPYTLKQAPGPENALGPVKFDFPNDHAVFLHGTPTVKLFDKQDRFFSSGCVRTQKPIDLAKFVLQDDAEWPADRIDAVLKSAKTTLVPLKRPLPVHITYMTAWVDEDGVMQFRKDAYSYDDLPNLPSTITEQMVASNEPLTTRPSTPGTQEGRGK